MKSTDLESLLGEVSLGVGHVFNGEKRKGEREGGEEEMERN